MQRRKFVSASIAATATALTQRASALPAATAPREYYQLRRYTLRSGPQVKLNEDYFSGALIPALHRLGMGPIGAFRLDIGPETPTNYLLVSSTSVEALVTIDLHLANDATFMAAAEPFWSAPAISPAFLRVESSLHVAFEGWPKLTPPASAAGKGKRIFQMRTYESPSFAAHVRKVEMFNSGEFEIFQKSGFRSVFFGDTLIGPRVPSLTYMLSFADMAELDAQWDVFRNAPEWNKLSTAPRYGSEAIVSNIANLILSPLAASQI